MNRKVTTRLSLLSLILSTAGFTASARADVTLFSTGDFVPSEWSSHVSSGSTGTGVAFTEPTGGNPGAYRRVSLAVGPFENILDAQLWNVAVFTPATQGVVASVSLAYDISRVFTSDLAATQVAKGVAVQQDGVLYGQLLGVAVVSPPDWDSVAVADLVPMFPAINWTDGSAITFGFYNSVSTTGAGFTIDGGYDNYRVTVAFTPLLIPEPAMFACLGMGLIGVLAARNRRWRRPAGRTLS
jgi:hypothetical protein